MAYKIMSLDVPRYFYQTHVDLDLTRKTAILYRQSRRGSDRLHIEGRMLQETLYPFVFAARGEGHDENIEIVDEGSGVSGTKGIDKRLKLRKLHEDIANNLIGDIVLARADRLFRDKHFNNVATFTQLAERMRIKVIVPMQTSVIVYDFTKEKDLQAFQEAMIQAYAYIVNQIGYMQRARALKVSKGYYGGGNLPLPFVLDRDMPKEFQVPVIFDPWLEYSLDLFKKFKEFNFSSGRIARYVEDKPYIFPFMDEDALKEYWPITVMTKTQKGYTFSHIETLLYYLSNLTLAGFVKAGKDLVTSETILIPHVIDAAIPLDLFEPCFASITGNYLDGTPFLKTGKQRQYRRTGIETDAILHGLLTSDDGQVTVFAKLDEDYPVYDCRKGGYFGQKTHCGLGRVESEWATGVRFIDRIVLDRLIALAEYDNTLVDRVKKYFGSVSSEGQSALEVLDTHIKNTQDAIIRVGKTIVALTKGLVDDQGNPIALPESDPNIKEQRDLYIQLRRLQKQRDQAAKQAKADPTTSITNFYHTLSHLRAEFHKRDPQDKKDIMRKLIEEVKLNSISPHLFVLTTTWISPLARPKDGKDSPRDDVALLWRCMPTKSEETNAWTTEEEDALRALYPDRPLQELMQAIPNKTRGQIKNKAYHMGVLRDFWHIKDDGEKYHWTVSYRDLQEVTKFADTEDEKAFLWREINSMAEQTKRGDLTPLWFLPIDAISFSQALCVTDMNTTELSGPTWREILRTIHRSW